MATILVVQFTQHRLFHWALGWRWDVGFVSPPPPFHLVLLRRTHPFVVSNRVFAFFSNLTGFIPNGTPFSLARRRVGPPFPVRGVPHAKLSGAPSLVSPTSPWENYTGHCYHRAIGALFSSLMHKSLASASRDDLAFPLSCSGTFTDFFPIERHFARTPTPCGYCVPPP